MKLTSERVYELLRQIPKGKVTTYKLIAAACGSKAYRAVGQILRCNPDAPRTPCHRVVSSRGTIGGFMGATDGAFIRKKRKLLMNEGITFDGARIRDFEKLLHTFAGQTA